ncbi:MAG: AmmeMemoRadiSam system protein B [Verrucomicrobia bacterium]|nr:AmmeMemoRadiSam system protein B [Verrucomicrobiota bacterium]
MQDPLRIWSRGLIAVALLAAGCQPQAETHSAASEPAAPAKAPAPSKVRPPAVAGLFYPNDPEALKSAVDRCLAAAPTRVIPGVRALICPHAGYEYSGPTAACAYRQVAGRPFDTVIILAASHYAWFNGVSVPATDAYETPLGRVPVSASARELAARPPFVLEPRCAVQRPSWAAMAPRTAPAAGEDTPETWEHSVEVEVPFLQRALGSFAILPVVFGRADPAGVARALAPRVDDSTLVVVSTDLSHFHGYDEARALDRQTLQWICALDTAALEAPGAEERACGRMAVLTLMHLARLKGWKAHLLDYRNSGDTAGDKRRVVGYAAVAFADAAPPAGAGAAGDRPSGGGFQAAERAFLLGLARQTLECVTAGRSVSDLPAGAVPEACRAAKGCFVTLTKSGQLRGCIGNILPACPLYRAVIDNACNAALRDTRFAPVTSAEVGALRIEVSVLTMPQPLTFSSPDDLLAKLQPGRDGVLLKIGERGATFLPHVWEQLPEKTQFLSHLAAKAGCAPSAWRGKDVAVSVYHAEAFGESR